MKRFVFLLLVLVLAAVLPIAAFAQQSDTVVIRGFGNITTFNPLFSSDGASYQAYALLWPKPIDTDSFTSAAKPGLTSWTISPDGLTYTFKIRPDAVWSDGTPITSDDMIFTINAILSPKVDTVLESNVASIDHVNKVDDKTYQVVLKNADCAALSNLSGIPFLPSKKFAADFSDLDPKSDNPSIENTNPDISGGPYILDSWAPDQSQNFHANPNYWAGAPKIQYLVNKVIGDNAVAVQSIQSDDIDYTYFHGDLFPQIADMSHLQYKSFPQLTVNFLALNWGDPANPQPAYDADGKAIQQTSAAQPLDDIQVRKAIAMAFNVDEVTATLGKDGATPMEGAVPPPLSWAYANNVQRYPFDLDGAKKLLADDGWADTDGDGILDKTIDGQSVKLEFTMKYSDILSDFKTEALVAQQDLQKIGVKVDLQLVEWANYLSEVYFGQNYDMTVMSNSGGTQTPDANDDMSLIDSRQDVPGSGNDIASYVNPDVDKLIDEARTVPGCDQTQRAALYAQIAQKQHDDVAYIWTYDPNVFQVANARIGNFNPGPSWVYYGYTSHVNEWTLNQ
ncbi:MAG TPA: ABC transporter substrate-binding protein [Phototrophicaceae bacterium]|nr:ABC transporter substrate-binding protein [Phototrophicaceae bacterium]